MTCGVDLVKIHRLEQACQREGFLPRYFTQQELALFASKKNPYPTIAANFAAKEALSKALGTGVRGFGLKDIGVLRDQLGKPYFVLSETMPTIKFVDVSLSHTDTEAMAFVILEK